MGRRLTMNSRGPSVPVILFSSPDTRAVDVLFDALVQRVAERAAELVLARLPGPEAEAVPEFLCIAEAADLLRCRPQRIYNLCSDGRLTRYKDGSRVLIRRAELVAYLAGGLAPV